MLSNERSNEDPVPPSAAPHRPDPESTATTANRILDAAESLFIDRGYAATSVRAIAQRAAVNLGAAHYHFGSKRALFAAVVERCFEPIQEQRNQALEALLAQPHAPTAGEIVEAFLVPLTSGPTSEAARLIARLFGEPIAISQPLIETQFGPTFERFSQAFERALPNVDPIEIRWRFHFMIGAMLHTLTTGGPISTPQSSRFEAIQKLQAFAVAGLSTSPDSPSVQENET